MLLVAGIPVTRETVLNRKEYEVGVAWQVDVTVVTDHPVICISLLIPSLYSVPPTRQDLNVELQSVWPNSQHKAGFTQWWSYKT